MNMKMSVIKDASTNISFWNIGTPCVSSSRFAEYCFAIILPTLSIENQDKLTDVFKVVLKETKVILSLEKLNSRQVHHASC